MRVFLGVRVRVFSGVCMRVFSVVHVRVFSGVKCAYASLSRAFCNFHGRSIEHKKATPCGMAPLLLDFFGYQSTLSCKWRFGLTVKSRAFIGSSSPMVILLTN